VHKLIIGSFTKREIGEVYTSLTDHRRILHKGQRFKVVGISNLEDWIACMKALGSEPYWEEIAIPCDFYYEIETD
jgi:hypothetical protein